MMKKALSLLLLLLLVLSSVIHASPLSSPVSTEIDTLEADAQYVYLWNASIYNQNLGQPIYWPDGYYSIQYGVSPVYVSGGLIWNALGYSDSSRSNLILVVTNGNCDWYSPTP